MKPVIQKSLASLAVATGILASAIAQAGAHEVVTHVQRDNVQRTGGINCAGAWSQVKSELRDRAQRHCRIEHGSGANALRQTSFIKGTCQKIKTPGSKAVYQLTGGQFSYRCR